MDLLNEALGMNDPQNPAASPLLSDPTKKLSRCINTSMTSEAILERLQTMSELSRFCFQLGQARRIGKVSDLLDNHSIRTNLHRIPAQAPEHTQQ